MRTVRSFVRRAGRATPAQKRVLGESSPYLLAYPFVGNWETWFGRKASLRVVEIGFGMGDALLHYAEAFPETDFLGIEVHAKGVAKLLLELDRRQITNVRLCMQECIAVLEALPAHSLESLHIFFPDPWPKKKHQKRRLIQKASLALFASRLSAKGCLHLATDWAPYAEHMRVEIEAFPCFVPCALGRAGRPITKFEQRGVKRGYTIQDLRFSHIIK